MLEIAPASLLVRERCVAIELGRTIIARDNEAVERYHWSDKMILGTVLACYVIHLQALATSFGKSNAAN